jgi:hypothetical protein
LYVLISALSRCFVSISGGFNRERVRNAENERWMGGISCAKLHYLVICLWYDRNEKMKTFNKTLIQPANNSLSNRNHPIRLMLAQYLQKLSDMLPCPFMSIAENHVFHVITHRERYCTKICS